MLKLGLYSVGSHGEVMGMSSGTGMVGIDGKGR
jgi:hypothetical protein